MHRLTVRYAIAAATFGLLLVPVAPARGAGCEVMRDLRDRAECQARAEAREAARDEVDRQLESRTGAATSSDATSSSRSTEWRAAMDEADGFDAGTLLETRPLAAVGGLAWFFFAVRSRSRARARASRT